MAELHVTYLPPTWGAYYAMLGEGGEEKFERVSQEIDDNIEKTENEIAESKNKTFADLDPLEQLLFTFDAGIQRYQQLEEENRLKHYRDEQFRRYVKDAYGINI